MRKQEACICAGLHISESLGKRFLILLKSPQVCLLCDFTKESLNQLLCECRVNGNVISQTTQREEVVSTKERLIGARIESFRSCLLPFGKDGCLDKHTCLIW